MCALHTDGSLAPTLLRQAFLIRGLLSAALHGTDARFSSLSLCGQPPPAFRLCDGDLFGLLLQFSAP